AADLLDVARIENLGHDADAGLGLDARQQVEAFVAQALERVGRSARLPRAPAQERRTLRADVARDLGQALFVLDRARAGDQRQEVPAEARFADADHRLGLPIPRNRARLLLMSFARLARVDHGMHAAQVLEARAVLRSSDAR